VLRERKRKLHPEGFVLQPDSFTNKTKLQRDKGTPSRMLVSKGEILGNAELFWMPKLVEFLGCIIGCVFVHVFSECGVFVIFGLKRQLYRIGESKRMISKKEMKE